MRENPKPNQIYRHFKGNFYKIICIATHSETGEQLVVYQALYGDMGVYVRPLDMFMSPTDKEKYPEVSQKYRFALMEDVLANIETKPVKTPVKSEETKVAEEEKAVTEPEAPQKQPVDRMKKLEGENKEAESEKSEEDSKTAAEPARSEQDTDIAPALAPELLEYLDASTNKRRLEILIAAKEKLTQAMIDTMAAVIDVDIEEGDLVVRYEQLKYCLETKIRYEVTRR